MKLTRTTHALALAMSGALAAYSGLAFAQSTYVPINENEDDVCLGGRTGDLSDPISACPNEERLISVPELQINGPGYLKPVSVTYFRRNQQARMTMQQRTYTACKISQTIQSQTYWYWAFTPNTIHPCGLDWDRVEYPVPQGNMPLASRGQLLCARWRVRNPTEKELYISYHYSTTTASRIGKNVPNGTVLIRDNQDRTQEPGILEDEYFQQCIQPEYTSDTSNLLAWPSKLYLAIGLTYQQYEAGIAQGSPITNPNSWGGMDRYTDHMNRVVKPRTGNSGGRYYVALDRVWIQKADGQVLQELN